jgi:hypothetical protein
VPTPAFHNGDHITLEWNPNETFSFNVGDDTTPGPNRYVLLLVWQDRDSSDTLSTATIGGVGADELGSGVCTVAGYERDWKLYGFPASDEALTGSQTVQVNGSGADTFKFNALICTYYNVHQVTAPSGIQEYDATSATPEVTVSSTTGDLVVALLVDFENARTVSSYNTGVSGRYDEEVFPRRGIVMDKAGAASVAIGLTWSGNASNTGAAISLPASAAGGQPTVRRFGGIRHGRPGGMPGVNIFRDFVYCAKRRIFLPSWTRAST